MYSPKRLSALIGSDTVRQRITVIFCPRFVALFSGDVLAKNRDFPPNNTCFLWGLTCQKAIWYDIQSSVTWKENIADVFRVKTLYNVVTSRPAMNSLIIMFSRFDRIPAGNRGTDILTEHSPRYAYASCGKNHTAYELILCLGCTPYTTGSLRNLVNYFEYRLSGWTGHKENGGNIFLTNRWTRNCWP